ncbi:MAG TPA: hypothetical protein ENJ95_19330 [Bacteroidetes bacterium]|nr:hypothetical protein [Bacteroidota bacterium]
MKKILLFIFFCLSSFLSNGQSFFTAGANYTVQSFSYNFPFGKQKTSNFKLTPLVGYGYNVNLKGKWSYQPGIYISNFGTSGDSNIDVY